jgi:hypothetical protein
MFSALVVMICCAVPAFADDVSSVVSSSNVNREKRFSQMIDYAKNNNIDIENSHYIMTYSEDSSQYYWWYYIFFIPDDILVNDTLILTHGRYSSSFTISFINARVSNYGNSDIDALEYRANVDVSSFSLYVDDDEQSHSYPNHIFKSNIKITNNGDDITPTDPNAVPAPFTVTYTPELSLNMQNKIYYPSKGGANADENGLVAAENNNINLDIKLTPEFLKTFNEKDLGKSYGSGTYAVLCCLSKNLLNAGDDLQRFFDEDVVLYAMNHDGNYYKGQDDEKIKSDGSSSDDLNSNDTVDTFEPYLTLYQGRTPIYTIPRDGKLTVSFDLTSIDYKTHGLTDDSKLYVNVIGVFVKNNGHVTPQNGEKTEDTNSSTWLGSYAYQEDFTNLKTCEKIDDFVKSVDEETGKPETFKAYRVYSVISDSFSYEKFPDYVPKVYKDKDGNTYNPSTTKLKDLCNIPPSKVTDVDLAKGSDGVINDGSYMQPDDYNKYLDKKKINANFGSVDFTDIKSIFSTTGTYWDFLTAALSCLPSWFYAVFSAWFVLFLAIALIKLVLPT